MNLDLDTLLAPAVADQFVENAVFTIIFLALVVLGFMVWGFWRHIMWFKKVNDKIKELTPSAEPITRHHLDELTNNIIGSSKISSTGLGYLRSLWLDFAKSLRNDKYGNDSLIGKRHPDQIFNAEEGKIEPSFIRIDYSSLPAYFVTFGLLATFYSLAAVLDSTAGSLEVLTQTSTQKEIRDEMTKALALASVKFLISISGLLASMLISITYKICSNILSKTISIFNHEIAMRIDFSYTNEQEQLEVLHTISHDINTLSDVLAEKLQTSIEAGFEKAKLAMESLANSVERLHQELDGTVNTLHVFKDGLENLFKQVVNDLENVTNQVVNSLKEVTGDFVSSIRDATNQMSHALDNASETFDTAINRATDNMVDSIDAGTNSMINRMKRVNSDLTESIRQLIKDLNITRQVYVKEISAAQMAFADSTASYISSNKNYALNYADTLSKLQSIFEENAQKTQGTLTRAFDLYNNKTKEHVDHFMNSIKLLQEELNKIATEMNKIRIDSSSEVTKASSELSAAVNRICTASQALEEKSNEMIKLHEKLDDLPDKIKTTIEITADNTTKVAKENLEKAVDNSMTAQVKLSKTADSTADSLTKLKASAEDLARHYDKKKRVWSFGGRGKRKQGGNEE